MTFFFPPQYPFFFFWTPPLLISSFYIVQGTKTCSSHSSPSPKTHVETWLSKITWTPRHGRLCRVDISHMQDYLETCLVHETWHAEVTTEVGSYVCDQMCMIKSQVGRGFCGFFPHGHLEECLQGRKESKTKGKNWKKEWKKKRKAEAET